MRVDFGKTFSSAFRYALDFNKLLPFFIINLVTAAAIFIFMDSLVRFIPQLSSNMAIISSLALSGMALVIVFVVITLARIFFQNAITDNARFFWQRKKQKLSKSFQIAKKKFVTVVLTLILAGIISVFVNIVITPIQIIPVFGVLVVLIVSFIVSMVFLFLIQIIMISNKGVVDSLKEGYRLFTKNMFDVFIFWLILGILSIILFGIAMLPVAVVFISILGPFIASLQGAAGTEVFTNLIALMRANTLGFAIATFISSLIISYVFVFQEAAKTFFYMQKKK